MTFLREHVGFAIVLGCLGSTVILTILAGLLLLPGGDAGDDGELSAAGSSATGAPNGDQSTPKQSGPATSTAPAETTAPGAAAEAIVADDKPTPIASSSVAATSTKTATQATPTPAASQPPPGTASLRVGSATVAPGASASINVTADVTNLGAYTMDIQYDSSRVTATECSPVHGVCSIDIVASDTIRLNGIISAGITGDDILLGTITFLAGNNEGSAALTVDEPTLLDKSGEPLNVTVTNGAITIELGGAALRWGDHNCSSRPPTCG